jgi:predicted enzyme involved in methoxymalonyl-ACP biosynthesis
VDALAGARPRLAAAPKVFLTDLDGVLWPGTVAEDGLPDAYAAGGVVGQLSKVLARSW